MKFITVTHLKKHCLTSAQYLEKFPESKLTSEEHREKLRQKMLGREITWKDKISTGTKIGMHKLESWAKFQEHIDTRDTSSFGTHFKSDLPETKTKMYTTERNERVSVGKTAWWADGRKGKKIEELWGEEKGKEIRRLKSEQTTGKKNPGYGKIYEAVGTKVGRYKGHLFRGILEYSFYKQLENEGKLETAQYEPFRIPYVLEGIDRTYTPDFLIDNRLIEIKPAFLLTGLDIKIEAKRKAAIEYCSRNSLKYEILTEYDFPQKTYTEAYADENIKWIRR